MKKKRRNRSHRDTKAEAAREKPELASSILIPGLPNEVALIILVRLPKVVQARLCLVCRSWKDAMEPAAMSLMRKTLHISEVWLVAINRFYKYALFTVSDALRRCTRRIYRPPQLQCRSSSSLVFMFCGIVGHEVLIAVKQKHTAPAKAKALDLQGLYSFDGRHMKWNDTKYSSLPSSICGCAADMDSGYLYAIKAYGVERLYLKTKMWEVLPDPHVKRKNFAGVMWQSRFCMVGGVDAHNSVCNSGEIWDMASQEWILVPELWPFEVFQNFDSMSSVAVVMDRLYALRISTRSVELMCYETSSKSWISLGYAPVSNDCYRPGCQLFGVDQELWLVDKIHMTILASKPSLSEPLSWRIIPYGLKDNVLIRYVGAMLV